MSPRLLALAAFAAVLLLGRDLTAQEEPASPIYVETDEAEPLLKQAADAETAGHWDIAVERYTRVLREHPDSMVPLGTSGKSWRSVRRHVFERISKFPAEGLEAYRTANDAVAKSLYEQALREGGAGLQRVVDDYFFTTVGDDAAARLADIFAEQGRLQDALHCWELAARLYPKPDVAMPPLVAKWAAACRRAGDDKGWEEAKARLEALGDASLMMSGRKVTAKEAVAILEHVKPAQLRTDRGADWPRIGGNNAATRVSESSARNDVRMWSFPSGMTGEALTNHLNQARQVWQRMGAQSSFLHAFPAVGPGGEVIVSDGVTMWAMALEDGKPLWQYPLKEKEETIFTQTMVGQPRVMSLVAPVIADGRVYANFLPRTVNMGGQNEVTFLAAFGLDNGVMRWSTKDDPELQNAWFGSAPVVYGGRVYAAITNSGNGSPSAELVVLNADTGKIERKVFLCEGRRAMPGWGGWMISEAPVIAESGGVLFINTNLGALAAIQAATFEVLWMVEYETAAPKQGPNRRWPQQMGERNGRGLSPIVVLDQRVCFLAGDADNYLEYDARSGKKLLSVPARIRSGNSSTGADAVRWFAGIRDGHAWFQGDKYAFAIDLTKVDPAKPDDAPVISLTQGRLAVRAAGKGFLTANRFYLPLDAGINVYEAKNFKLAFDASWQDDTRLADAGTLLLVGDRMLSLSLAGITCFTDRETFDKGYGDVLTAANPDLRKLERHAEVLSKNPTTYSGAIADYEKIAAACATTDPARATRARSRIMELHLALGSADYRSGRWADAISHYKLAIAAAPVDAALGDVFRDMGDCFEKLGHWKEAVAVYQEVIEKYGEKLLATEAGLARPVRQFAEAKIREIVLEHGLDLYEDVEKRAREMLEKLKEKGSSDEWRKWIEQFPNSSSAPSAAGQLADRLEAEGRLAEAGLALIEVSRRPEMAAGCGPLVARAGELFAKSGAWDRVEGAATRLERCHAAETVKVSGRDLPAAEAAAALRALRPAVTAVAGTQPAPWREWTAEEADKARVARDNVSATDAGPTILVPRGRWADLDPASVVFVQRAAVLEARDAVKDVALWTSIDPRGYLGVTFNPQADGSTSFGTVVPGTPADQGGVQAGDIAEEWNGVRLRSEDHLRREICLAAGKEITLAVRRAGNPVTLKFTIGRRNADTEPAEAADQLLFTDGGLLLIVRPACVQAVRPATGETVWVHCPVHPRRAGINRAATADGRVFLSWIPDPTSPAAVTPGGEKEVSVEAIDAATGKPLWLYRETGADITDLIAVSGTGTVVRCERRGVGGVVQVLDAATGLKKRELAAAPMPSSAKLAVAQDGGKLLLLREANLLSAYDLFTGLETSRDLGGQKAIPDAFTAWGGQAALAYGSARRVIVASADAAKPRFMATLADGLPAPAGMGFGSANTLYVLTRSGQAGDRPASVLRKYVISGADMKEEWKVTLASGNAEAGLISTGADFVLTWSGNAKDPLVSFVRCWQARSGRLLWELEPAVNPAAGPLRDAGLQAGTAWVQYQGRLVTFR